MYTSFVRITVKQSARKTQSVDCSYVAFCTCIDYKKSRTCVHMNSTIRNEKNRMRTMSFAERNVFPCGNQDENESWKCNQAPFTNCDSVKIWLVYRRMNMSSHFPTSSAVMLNDRE